MVNSTCCACSAALHRRVCTKNGFTIVQCRCGLARTLLPVGFDPTSVYTKAYFDGSMADGYANYTQSAEQLRAEFAPLARELSERLPSSADASHNGGNGKPGLIEIGSAYGYFLDVARQYFDVAGVEVADDARLAAQQRGHRVYANVTELTTANNRRQPDAAGSPRAAAAVMLDVIEHLQDPRATLDAVAACSPAPRLSSQRAIGVPSSPASYASTGAY